MMPAASRHNVLIFIFKDLDMNQIRRGRYSTYVADSWLKLMRRWLILTESYPRSGGSFSSHNASLIVFSLSSSPLASIMCRCFRGKRPTNLGVKEGKLAKVKSSPNCVSSQAPESDNLHFIRPLSFSGSPSDAIQKLVNLIEGMKNTEVIETTDDYLHAEFTTALMGFCDDVEFFAAPSGVLHVRSCSRLGYSDLGVNRKRVEAIRRKWIAWLKNRKNLLIELLW